jgi:hypothetical protein
MYECTSNTIVLSFMNLFSDCFKPTEETGLDTLITVICMTIESIQVAANSNEIELNPSLFVGGLEHFIPKHRVSLDHISFHQPLHWFLGLLMRHLGHAEVEKEVKGVWNRIFPLLEGAMQYSEDAIMRLVDPCKPL